MRSLDPSLPPESKYRAAIPPPGGAYTKEQYPMLAKGGGQGVREDPYTTTLHRRLAVPPPLAPPCPLHGGIPTPRDDTTAVDLDPRALSTFKPPMDHIYESPKFSRRHSADPDPFYHELDPAYHPHVIPSDHESDPDCDLDSPVAPPDTDWDAIPSGGYRPLAPPGEFTYTGHSTFGKQGRMDKL